MVKQNPDGTFTVVQHFKNGSFITNVGPSPGACDLDEPENFGGTVAAGVTGSMNGYFIIPLPPTTLQISDDPHCNALTMTNMDCTTTTFINKIRNGLSSASRSTAARHDVLTWREAGNS